MAKLGINTTPPLGTPLPDGGGFINSNFDELYTLLGDGNELYPGIVTSITAGSNISISTSTGNVSIAVSSSAFTETLDSVTDRGSVTNNGIRVGVITATSFVKNGGTASEFLKADGSVDNNTYLTSSSPINLDLDDVTTNGNTTTNNIQIGSVVALGNIAAGASILAVNAAYASSFRRIGGSSTEFLKGDGTVDTNTYTTKSYVDSYSGSWTKDGVGISTTANVGIGNSADPSRQLKVDGSTELYELRVAKEGQGIRVSQTGGIDNDGNNFHIWATEDLFLEAGGAGTGTGRGIRILNDSDSVYIDHDLEVDHDVVVGGGVSAVGVVTASFFEGDGSRITNIAGAGDTTGLASEAYVDQAVLGVSTVTDALVSLSGVPAGSVGLGTFTQDIISDDIGIKSAFQELETSISQLQTSTTANNYKWSNTNDATITAQFVATNTSNWADATVVYIHRRARHNIDMKNALENMFILGAKMFIQRPDVGGKFFTAYISGAPTITGTDTNQVYAYPVSNVTTEGQITTQGMKINIGIFVDTNTYQVGLATAGLASIAYVDTEIANIGTADTAGLASIAYVDQEIAGVGGGNTADVRTNSLTVSGVSTFNSPIETNSGIIKPANPGVGLQLNANDNTKLIQGVQFAGSAGAVELYGYNSKKLETNLSGVVVSGVLTATSFSGDGSGLTNLGVSTITDALVELSGVPAGSVGLGTFEKGIINDNVGIKSALQDLELSSAETSTAAKINNYEWSNNNDNTIGQTQITTDATNWADATKIYVHRRAKNNVDMQNVFNNTLVRGAKVYIQKTNDATKAFTAHISSDSPIVTGTGTNQVFEYSVIDVSTTGTVFNDGITLNFGIYVDTNTYMVGLATAGLASITYVDNLVAISTAGLGSTSSASDFTWDTSLIPDTNDAYDLGSATNRVRDLYISDSSIKFQSGDLTIDSSDQMIWNGDVMATRQMYMDGDNSVVVQVGNLFNQYYNKTETDSIIGVSTVGLASTEYVDQQISGGALPSRSTLTGTTGVVNAGDTTLLTISGYKTYALQSIQVTQASWVRIYTDPASRLNDSSRLYTEDPQPGSGLIAEVRTETSGTSTFLMSPGVIGWNNNSTSNIYVAVTNNESSNLTITVNLQAVQMEA